MTEEAEKLANEHWNWLESVFKLVPKGVENLPFVGKIYRDAFIHGYKHGAESIKERSKIQ